MSDVNRAEQIAGMRELLDFLEANPVIPLGVITPNGYTCYPKNSTGGQDIPGALDELRRIGAAIGVEPTCPYGQHVVVNGPTFRGGVHFDAIVCDAEKLFRRQQRAAEDVTQVVGEVGGSAVGTEPPTAATGPLPRLVQPAPITDPALADTPLLVDEQVWTAKVRQGLVYHRPGDEQTDCGRAQRTGELIPLTRAVELRGNACGHCWPYNPKAPNEGAPAPDPQPADR